MTAALPTVPVAPVIRAVPTISYYSPLHFLKKIIVRDHLATVFYEPNKINIAYRFCYYNDSAADLDSSAILIAKPLLF
ncbi:MAG: hypothetical protein WBF33_30580 [Candidatus Nitrosopolaris sp.]